MELHQRWILHGEVSVSSSSDDELGKDGQARVIFFGSSTQKLDGNVGYLSPGQSKDPYVEDDKEWACGRS